MPVIDELYCSTKCDPWNRTLALRTVARRGIDTD